MDTTLKTNKKEFRNYDQSDATAAVRDHYKKMRQNQSYDYVRRMKQKYLTYDNPMGLWEAFIKLNELVDVSDPDLDLPNIQHLAQSAEAIRGDNRPDWMQLVGLIHDLGKMMFIKGCDADGTSQVEQWGLVGDVFVVGAALPDTLVYPEFNDLNPDMDDPRYNTENGIYPENCGLDRLELAWGHDEYLYQVLKHHQGNKLPEEGMVMIRYHSFYPWHTGRSYTSLMKDKDNTYLEWILDFNQYDLYSKSQVIYDLEDIKEYYAPIAEKYLGTKKIYF